MVKKSEFGRGLAVCLVKFAEHFENDMARMIDHAHLFYGKLKGDRARLDECGADVRRDVDLFDRVYLKGTEDVERGLSRLIETWANGAADHLYEIEVPERMAGGRLGKLVGELRSKGLRIGHGFTGGIWTYEDFVELQELARKIALELDRGIGLEPDLGEW
jgi:hypothetical protein